MKIILLVAVSAIAGTMATEAVLSTDFVKEKVAKTKPGTQSAIRTGTTAALSVGLFGLLSSII